MKRKNVSKYFGCMVFDDRVMKASLSAKVYQSLRKTRDEGVKLDSSVADAVAEAMKEWAVSKGATHYTHWLQPLTGITADTHDSYIAPSPTGGVIMEFCKAGQQRGRCSCRGHEGMGGIKRCNSLNPLVSASYRNHSGKT